MKKYKVIQEFSFAKKGDVLEYDANKDEYFIELDNSNEGVSAYMSISINPEYAQFLVEQGFLTVINDTKDDQIAELKKEVEDLTEYKKAYSKAIGFIDGMRREYKKVMEDAKASYAIGDMPACVKVETDTVNANMIKLLDKVEEILNEDDIDE